ncbi:MAG: hypothetical protein QG608_3575 [Actinomycetota bacterium]|nr:hypothetical protein [Actinomycetota bacterium]
MRHVRDQISSPWWAGALPTDDLAHRANRHAALGEPVRLAIIDRLVVEDASPGEFSNALGIPTNLLAHHLKVLSGAGLIRKERSEGDRRRWYVRLRWEDPETTSLVTASGCRGPGLEGVGRVVFVCTRNSARSPLAAAAWRRFSPIPSCSAGIRPDPVLHPRALGLARRHGLDLKDLGHHRIVDIVRPGDLVIAVCDSAHEELCPGPEPGEGLCPPYARHLHWAVPDPARQDTDEAFETTFAEILRRIGRAAAGSVPRRTVENVPISRPRPVTG